MKSDNAQWSHPGGKMIALGADKLTNAELLAILIGTGIPNKPAEKIASELLEKYSSFKGLADQPFENLYKIKGLKKVKVIRIAGAFEIARRIVQEVLKDYEPRKK
ncbi:MAG: hypothetical protein HY762_02140 [Planctomycetes bacterium]|nr:hypothetical protein [Planctomycetota bacterium]